MDTMHLKGPLVLFGSEGSDLTLPLLLRSLRIIILCHCTSTKTNDHCLVPSFIHIYKVFNEVSLNHVLLKMVIDMFIHISEY